MYPKFSFIRRFTQEVQQVARFVAFPFELYVEVTEEEELQTRGYRVA